MEVKTLRPKMIKKVKEFFGSLNEDIVNIINESNWSYLYSKIEEEHLLRRGEGWAFHGCFWSTIYSIDNNIYDELKIIPEGAFAYTDIEEINLKDIVLINSNVFYNSKISKVTLSNKLHTIGDRAFITNLNYVIHIRFKGTRQEFKSIRKGTEWYKDKYDNRNRVAYVVCDDGDLEYGG